MARPKNRKSVMVDDWELDEERWKRQVACVELLDARMGDLLAYASVLATAALLVLARRVK